MFNNPGGRAKMTKEVQLTTGLDWEKLFEEINKENEEYIIQKGKEPVAVVMPYLYYQYYQSLIENEEKSVQRLFALIERNWKQNKNVPLKEIESVVEEAVTAARKAEK